MNTRIDWLKTCPECKQGKHLNCTKTTLSPDDVEVPCSCAEGEHQA